MGTYDMLLSPIQLTPSVTLKNRMVKSPQATMFWNEDGTVSERALACYESFAKGGASMIIVGGMSWQRPPEGVIYCRLDDDRFIPGLKKFTDAIHAYDCKIVAQFHHLGPSARASIDGRPPMGPSALTVDELPSPEPHVHPGRAVTLEEMAEYKEDMIKFAERAKAAGFDGVEVHAANGYFLASFLSGIWNKRTDEYGVQNIQNRTRYVTEVIRGIRERVGNDYMVGVRLNGQEWGAKGRITPDIAAQNAVEVEKAGVDYISVNGYGYGPLPFKYCPDYFSYPDPEDFMKPFMKDYEGLGINMPGTIAIKNAVHVPVFTAGRMDENKAETALEKGYCDVLCLGRTLFADPEFPNKVKEGRLDEIMHCTRCATCEDPLTEPRKCRVNPALGHEIELEIKPTETPKNVMVIGGGPAGMECALVAAERGHNVTLYEKSGELGGRTKLAAMIKHGGPERVMPIYDHLTTMVGKSNIKVELKTEVDPKLVANVKPDAVVVANSSPYYVPDIPGIDRKNVYTIPAMSKLSRVPMKMFGPAKLATMSEKVFPVGKKLVIWGGGAEGAQCAEFMRKRGKGVVIVAQTDDIGGLMPEKYKVRLEPWFDEQGVRIIRNADVTSIERKGAWVEGKDGRKEFVDCDSVMVMLPERRDSTLYDAIKKIVPETYEIGSTLGGDNAFFKHAFWDGRKVGCTI